MEIVLDSITGDGRGSFYVSHNGENIYHFLTQIDDEDELRNTLKKYLTQVEKDENIKENKKIIILNIVNEVNNMGEVNI